MATDIIQAEYETLASIAQRFERQADETNQLNQRVRNSFDALQSGGWIGRGAEVFFKEMEGDIFPALGRLALAMEDGHDATRQIVEVLRTAEEEAAHKFLVGNGVFAATIGAVTGSNGRSDRRTDRRIESDRIWRRSPGGRGVSSFDSDWAGRTILEHYLIGGGEDLIFNNDPNWTHYMKDSERLKHDLRTRALKSAQDLFEAGNESITVNESFPMELENGEGIVGYQYLHGTNANAGGFQRTGLAKISPDGMGGYTVEMDLSYTWNDVIDPNHQYITDTGKNLIAEIITLGRAEPYEIHISWSEKTVVHLDKDGKPISIKGWPSN